MPKPGMGNLVYVPGSHREQYFDAYDTREEVVGQLSLCVRRGALTLMDCALWHRTAPNDSAITRMNLYLGYCPSWIPSADRNMSDPAWLAGLNREQRIIMRSYEKAYNHAKPPPEDFPLFLDRETGSDREPGRYRDLVPLFHRKRTAWWEGRVSESIDDGGVDLRTAPPNKSALEVLGNIGGTVTSNQ